MTSQRILMSRWHWRNWPVLVKLVAAGLVPTLVALVLGVLRIVDQAGTVPALIRITQIADVQQELSGLLAAVERERDLTTEFVAKGRTENQAALELQFRAVDSQAAAVRTAAEQVQGLESTGYDTVLDQLRGLRPLRQSVTVGTGPVGQVVTEYSSAIDPLITLDAALVRQLDDVAVADDAAAAHALLAIREQVSRQHAIVLAALIANRIEAPEISDVQTMAIRLDAEQEEFEQAVDPAQRTGYAARAAGEAELARQRLLRLVLGRGMERTALNIAPADWDERTTVAVEGVAGVENELRQRISLTAQALRDDARAAAGLNSVILFFALALGVLVAVLMARSMLLPLGVLRRTALDVADRRLPAAMVRVRAGDVSDEVIEPVDVSTREEIGQVARAFDEVHRQAVRLAGEQALLRAQVNDIFVNLARRSQGLVERQLQVIDRLEGGEQDPQQLENLFQLDHLATRMRRNSDNLLVLAGTEAVQRTSRPVRLVDVLRAAVSEVEQYQRLVLQQPPDVVVLGRTAGDLVHLLAELLDNATQFSPPDTHVILRAESGADGAVEIEVTDRGIGMTEAEFAEANERLATAPMVDASVPRRMGLFVVGRLAVRHGIGVRLRQGRDDVGVVACVTLPPRLVRSAAEIGSGAPGEAGTPREYPGGMGRRLANGSTTGQGAERTSVKISDRAPGRKGSAAQASTPIFDDVASAWFREHRGIPVRWVTAPSAPPADPVRVNGDPTRANGDPARVNGGFTAGGLPRRTPRALLMSGAPEQATSPSTPVRSAELVRTRLASYQQGTREGRQTRRNPDPAANGFFQHQEVAEETM